jgi:hypothetical protein|tara:strand:+ start:190 stop:387 length:198 start_codon:yes stop_codon:yes gene_type:complete
MNINYHSLIYLTHVFFIAPFLFYYWYVVRYQKKKLSNKTWDLLLIIIAVMAIYHAYLFISRNFMY